MAEIDTRLDEVDRTRHALRAGLERSADELVQRLSPRAIARRQLPTLGWLLVGRSKPGRALRQALPAVATMLPLVARALRDR